MLSSYTKYHWTLLIVFGISFFSSIIGLSLQGPFYPQVAESKGVKSLQYGFIFGIFYLIFFLLNPVFGKLIAVVDPVVIVKSGLFIIFTTTILFGFLNKIYDTTTFIVFSFALRIMEAIGFSSFLTASYSIIGTEFFDDIGTVNAILETCFGVGTILAPAVGGILYELQGYMLPFLVIGVFILCSYLVTFFLLKSSDRYFDPAPSSSTNGMISLLKTPEVILSLWSAGVGCLNFGFFYVTLEPHLRSLSLTSSKNGLMFMISGLSYMTSSIAWGRICDKWMAPQKVWSIGAIIVSISMVLMGPAPYLQISLNVPLCGIALIIMGIGQAAELISSFYCMNKVPLKIGFPNTISTFGLVSALYNSAFSFGEFVGTTLGGILLDSIGLPWGYHVLLLFHLLLAFATLLYCLFFKENVFPKLQIKDLKENERIGDKIPMKYDSIFCKEKQISR